MRQSPLARMRRAVVLSRTTTTWPNRKSMTGRRSAEASTRPDATPITASAPPGALSNSILKLRGAVEISSGSNTPRAEPSAKTSRATSAPAACSMITASTYSPSAAAIAVSSSAAMRIWLFRAPRVPLRRVSRAACNNKRAPSAYPLKLFSACSSTSRRAFPWARCACCAERRSSTSLRSASRLPIACCCACEADSAAWRACSASPRC